MKHRHQEVQVYSIQDRRSSDRVKRPWVVRWSVDGRQRSKSFHTRSEADRFRLLLMNAVQRGERFDEVTGDPSSWQPSLSDMNVYEWTRRWLCEQWVEWQPRTRDSAVESLAKLVIIAADAKVTWTLYELADRLRTRGWQVPAYPLTGDLDSQVVQRALIRVEITTDEINSLIADMRDAVEFLERHPVSVQMTQDEGTSFSH